MVPYNPLQPNNRPSSSAAAEPEERIRPYLREEGTDPDTLAAMEALVAESAPLIPEHVFKTVLLPLSYHEEGVAKDIMQWWQVTGSMTNGVRVVGLNGQILFTCPGLFPEMPLYKDRNGNALPWSMVITDSILRNNVHPNAGTERLVQTGSRYLPDIPPDILQAHREAWIPVWQRYGVGEYGASTAPTVEVGPSIHPTYIELEEEDEV
jgi:hypothetical protein